MKCENCGGEMLDIKDYCVNCGAKLKKESKNITLGGVFAIFLVIVGITIGALYLIANYNTNEEIKPFIDNKITENR